VLAGLAGPFPDLLAGVLGGSLRVSSATKP